MSGNSVRRPSVEADRLNELAQAARMTPLLAVLYEIVTTEHHYVEDLRFFVGSIMAPLEPVLSPSERRAIFSNAQQLLDLHEGVLAALTLTLTLTLTYDAQEVPEPQPEPQPEPDVLLARIAGAFAARIPFFKLYAEYCGNYVYAAQKLRAVRETQDEVKRIVAEIEAEHETTVLALLIRPVARICQYPLLFREVQKHMDMGGGKQRLASGAQFITVADEMLHTIDQVNEKVRQQENALRMRGILTAELQGAADLISPSRYLLHEAHVRLRAEGSLRPEWRAKRDYKAYIFSDLLVVASRNILGGGFALKLRLLFAELSCEILKEDDKPSFVLLHAGVTYRGSCASHAEARDFVARVLDAKKAALLKTLGALPTAAGMARTTKPG